MRTLAIIFTAFSATLSAALLAACNGDDVVECDGAASCYDAPPLATIMEPSDGATFVVGEDIYFRSAVDDDGALGDLDIAWINNDVTIETAVEPDDDGIVTFTLTGAALGEHLIELQVTDMAGNRGMDSVGISVVSD